MQALKPGKGYTLEMMVQERLTFAGSPARLRAVIPASFFRPGSNP
jgi:hypothetical protein